MLRWNSTGITVAGISSNPGIANNQLRTPWDVVVDDAYNMYIADTGNNRIQRYAVDSSFGTTVTGQANGSYGSSPSTLWFPVRVLFDSDGNLYVSDSSNNRVQFYRNGASSGTTVAGRLAKMRRSSYDHNSVFLSLTIELKVTFLPWCVCVGPISNSSNALNRTYGIARDPSSNIIYVSDYWNHRIMSYPPGATSGTLVIGGLGVGYNNTQLNYPVGLFFDVPSNSLIIANHVASNIVQYVLGDTSWTLLAGSSTGATGTASTVFLAPVNMVLDPMGNLYVSDRNNHRVQFFQAGQIDATTIAGVTNTSGSTATLLNWPSSLAVDNQLNLYVADTNNQRIQKFLRYWSLHQNYPHFDFPVWVHSK